MTPELEQHGLVVLERGWLSSNNVLLRGDAHRGAVVIDTGYWCHAPQTVALLRAQLRGEPLTRVLNTHLHSDHCGGNAAVAAAFACGIDVPAGEKDAVDAWDMSRLSYEATGQHCPRFTPAGTLGAPSVIAAGRWDWQVLAAPGHDPLSVALYQPDLGVLVSADALWENGFGVVFPELTGEPGFGEVRETLDLFARLPVRCVIPGHGGPFTDFHGALDRAHRRLDSFERDPRKHAAHAAKVLIKFHLLETRVQHEEALERWMSEVRYFDLVHARYFANGAKSAWLHGLLDEMCARGVLARTADGVRDT